MMCSWRKMICSGYECLMDPLECPPSISILLLLLLFSPHHALSLLVSAALARSGPPGRSGDGGLSAELEQKAGAPNLPDGALEKKRRRSMLFYHVLYVRPLKEHTLR